MQRPARPTLRQPGPFTLLDDSNRSIGPASLIHVWWSPDKRRVATREGFTLLEVLIVIFIIGVLMALLLPAISSIQGRVKVSQVVADIEGLQKSIADFNVTFGMDPPSRIRLYENPVVWNTPTNNAADNRERVRSRAIIRRLWPQFNFNLVRDIDNDNTNDEIFTLTGAECLVFFLGGIMQRDTSTTPTLYAARGFSKNPADPLQLSQSDSESRVGPFHEFGPGRFTDADNDNMPEYADTLPNPTAPYIYVSSNDGQGYDPQDLIVYQVPSLTQPSSLDMRDAYRQGDVDLTLPVLNRPPLSPGWKNKSFQIISPGLDRLYGTGGGYDQELGTLLPFDSNAPNRGRTHDESRHEAEADNITNFSGGLLD